MKLLVFISSFLLPVFVFASFLPNKGPRPHTACWEAQDRFSEIQVFLTDLNSESALTRVEIHGVFSQDERQILSEEATAEVRSELEVYVGAGFRLEISRHFIPGSSQRSARLFFTSRSGREASQDLLCDTLMYPMGKAQASF